MPFHRHCEKSEIPHKRIQRGGGAGGPDPLPLKNHRNIGFPCYSGPDPLKNHKATKPAFNVGPSSAGQPMLAHLWWYLDPVSPHKSPVKVGPPLTNFSRSAHGPLLVSGSSQGADEPALPDSLFRAFVAHTSQLWKQILVQAYDVIELFRHAQCL